MSVIYTTMPMELMFPENTVANKEYRYHNGRLMEVDLGEGEQARVVRLFSTDPADFLEEQYQPGSYL